MTKSPHNLSDQIVEDAQNITDENVKQHMLEAAETIEYLLKLLDHCVDYIHDNNEYGFDPLFLRAVREALGKA